MAVALNTLPLNMSGDGFIALNNNTLSSNSHSALTLYVSLSENINHAMLSLTSSKIDKIYLS